MATILIVEDNLLVQDMLSEVLQNQSFMVICADDGTMGLQKAKAQIPDLIISDLEMPCLDGLELLRLFRQDPPTDSVPVIICFSATDQQAYHRVLQKKATAYLHKPFNLTQLTHMVADQLTDRLAAPVL